MQFLLVFVLFIFGANAQDFDSVEEKCLDTAENCHQLISSDSNFCLSIPMESCAFTCQLCPQNFDSINMKISSHKKKPLTKSHRKPVKKRRPSKKDLIDLKRAKKSALKTGKNFNKIQRHLNNVVFEMNNFMGLIKDGQNSTIHRRQKRGMFKKLKRGFKAATKAVRASSNKIIKHVQAAVKDVKATIKDVKKIIAIVRGKEKSSLWGSIKNFAVDLGKSAYDLYNIEKDIKSAQKDVFGGLDQMSDDMDKAKKNGQKFVVRKELMEKMDKGLGGFKNVKESVKKSGQKFKAVTVNLGKAVDKVTGVKSGENLKPKEDSKPKEELKTTKAPKIEENPKEELKTTQKVKEELKTTERPKIEEKTTTESPKIEEKTTQKVIENTTPKIEEKTTKKAPELSKETVTEKPAQQNPSQQIPQVPQIPQAQPPQPNPVPPQNPVPPAPQPQNIPPPPQKKKRRHWLG